MKHAEFMSFLFVAVSSIGAQSTAEAEPGSAGDGNNRQEKVPAYGLYLAPFRATLDTDPGVRKDTVGNACRIASSYINMYGSDYSCSTARFACDGRENAVVWIADPWGSGHVDLTCPKFIQLSCSWNTDIDHSTEACIEAVTGTVAEDPAFITPGSFFCGLSMSLAITGAGITSGMLYPAMGTATGLLSLIPGVAGIVACAAVPF